MAYISENLKPFLNRKRTQKRGNGPQKEETDQQTEDLKLFFLKTGNQYKEQTEP